MSLSPWDLSGRMGFNFDLYRPRRASYVFATRTNRQRNESYRYATKSSLRHAGEHRVDFIEGMVRKNRKDSYRAATQRGRDVNELRKLRPNRPTNGVDQITSPRADRNRNGAKFRTIFEAPELRTNTVGKSLRTVRSLDRLSSLDSTKSSTFDGFLNKKAISLSSLKASSLDRKTIFNTLKEEEAFMSETVRRYRRNLIVLSVGFLLVFTAFRAIQNLQSSLNGEGKLGVISMGLVHSTMFFTCLFAPVFINKLTSKWTIILGLLFYLFWIAANFYPHFYTLIPTSIGVGFGQSLAWGAQVTYIQTLAEDYSEISQEVTQQELFRFNGIFLALFQTSHLWGNLLSSLLLDNAVFEELKNVTEFQLDPTMPHYCGMYDSCEAEIPYLWDMKNPDTKAASTVVLRLMGVLLVFAFVGFVIILILLEKIGTKSEDDETSCLQNVLKLNTATFNKLRRQYQACRKKCVWTNVQMLHQHPKFRLLVPLLIFNGFEQAFIYADYTKSYITCTIGIEYVGYNMITLGVVNSVFSIIVGVVSKYLPREAIIGMGAILQTGLLVFLLVWIPEEHLLPVFFAVSALWGICDAVWQTQCNYLVNLSCPDEHDVAFQNVRMLQGFGAAAAFLLGAFVCASVKLYILISLLVFSILCYVVVEIQLKNAEIQSALSRQQTGGHVLTPQARHVAMSRDHTRDKLEAMSRDLTRDKLDAMSRDLTRDKLNAMSRDLSRDKLEAVSF